MPRANQLIATAIVLGIAALACEQQLPTSTDPPDQTAPPSGMAAVRNLGGGNFWTTTGNVNADASNFIGTTVNQPFIIKTNGTEAIRVNTDGAVGIGTGSPQAGSLLHLETNGAGPELVVRETFPGSASQINMSNTTRTWILFSDASPDHFSIFHAAPGGGPSPAVLKILGGSGNVGIGAVTPSEKLHVDGSVLADAHLTPSSRRWKDNIAPIEGALESVLRLRGVSYDRKTDGRHEVGVIAEEVGAVIPEVVTYESNGVDAQSVDYARLVAVLIEAVKEQQAEIGELRALVARRR